MTKDEAFKRAFPSIDESYPLYNVIKSYFLQGYELGKNVGVTTPRRKWVERADRPSRNFPTGPLNLGV